MTDSRRALLVRLAVVLAVLRFVVYPWIEQQGERRDALIVLTNRLDRAQGVIENRAAIESASEQVRAQAAVVAQRFVVAESADKLRLDVQQRVTELVRRNGVGVTLFDWLTEAQTDSATTENEGFSRARFRIEYAGPLRQLAMVQGELEAAFPNLIVRRVAMNFRDVTLSIEAGVANVSLLADVYYTVGADTFSTVPPPVPTRSPSASAEGAAPRGVPQQTPGMPRMPAAPGMPADAVPVLQDPNQKRAPRGIAPPLGDDEEAV